MEATVFFFVYTQLLALFCFPRPIICSDNQAQACRFPLDVDGSGEYLFNMVSGAQGTTFQDATLDIPSFGMEGTASADKQFNIISPPISVVGNTISPAPLGLH